MMGVNGVVRVNSGEVFLHATITLPRQHGRWLGRHFIFLIKTCKSNSDGIKFGSTGWQTGAKRAIIARELSAVCVNWRGGMPC